MNIFSKKLSHHKLLFILAIILLGSIVFTYRPRLYESFNNSESYSCPNNASNCSQCTNNNEQGELCYWNEKETKCANTDYLDSLDVDNYDDWISGDCNDNNDNSNSNSNNPPPYYTSCTLPDNCNNCLDGQDINGNKCYWNADSNKCGSFEGDGFERSCDSSGGGNNNGEENFPGQLPNRGNDNDNNDYDNNDYDNNRNHKKKRKGRGNNNNPSPYISKKKLLNCLALS